MAIVIGPCWTNFCWQKLKIRILATFGLIWWRYVPHSRSYNRWFCFRPVFEDCIVSLRADVVWPPRSCDLTPLDYYWCRLLYGQPRQPFEWNYFPLLTGRIVLSNKKKKFEKIFSRFFLKHFPKKKLLGGPVSLII